MPFHGGEKHIFIPVHYLTLLHEEMESFKASEKLNGFQNWIVNNLYRFELPGTSFRIESILLVAVPHPMYSRVTVSCNGKTYSCMSLVSSDFDAAKRTLEAHVQNARIELIEAQNLPLKRLAVHSGFAVYGRNNVTYISGFGGSFSYIAFFTNVACKEIEWTALRQSTSCDKCRACLSACPTGAIRKERFLINNEICLSCLNESPEPFPDWLPESVHHTLYDCLKCQIPCPMNREQAGNIGHDVDFSEAETKMLLAGIRFDEYPEEMKIKAKYLGIDQWPEGIAKNVRTLIEIQDKSLKRRRG